MKGTAKPRSRSIPAPITASRFRSGRSTIATPPSGTGSGCWRSIAATFRPKNRGPMPFLPIAFPVFDPIAIAIGPIAIRWYALAYIGGIVLGWLYARALIKNEQTVGRTGADHAAADGRFHPLGHDRHHPRRPHRLCAVLQSAVLHPASGRDLRTVEGRHVVPWRLPRLRRRGDPVLPQARHFRSCRSATSPPRSGRSGCFSGGSPISSTANCGAGRPTPACPGR